MELSGKRVLITGGSSGIGLELARALVGRGARAVITGRRQEAIDDAVDAIGGDVRGLAADVATAAGRAATIAFVQERLGGLDILVNNAGGVRAGRLETTSEDEIRQMIEVNLAAPILLTRLAVPLLRKSHDALLINVSSGIAQVGLPFYATYAAVKAGVAHFGEAIRREWAGEGIGVLTVYPTATDTPMMATSGMHSPGGRESASDVAREVIDAIVEGHRDVVRGDAERQRMTRVNRDDPAAVDTMLYDAKATLEQAARDHSAL